MSFVESMVSVKEREKLHAHVPQEERTRATLGAGLPNPTPHNNTSWWQGWWQRHLSTRNDTLMLRFLGIDEATFSIDLTALAAATLSETSRTSQKAGQTMLTVHNYSFCSRWTL